MHFILVRYTLLWFLMMAAIRCTFGQQVPSSPFEVGAQMDYGFIHEHTRKIAHLVTHYPRALTIYANKLHTGESAWEERLGYPKTGLALTYFDYGNKLLGETWAVTTNIFLPLVKRGKNYEVEMKMGTGIAYATHPFDIDDNFRNTLLSNHWLFAIQAGLHFNYKLWERIYLKSALSLTHYSSAAFKQPNYGVNMVTAGIGAAYLFRAEEKVYRKTELPPFSKRIGVEFSVSGSLIETEVNQPEKHQVWGFSIYGTKRLSRGSRVNAGLDLSLNEGVRYQIQRKILADSTFEEVDYKRVGLVIGHELTVGRLSLLTQLGYYVHRQFEAIAEQPLFQRYGLRYYPSGRLFTGLYLKSHGFTAECAELTIGYRWER